MRITTPTPGAAAQTPLVRIVAVAILLAIVAFATACGDDDSTPAADDGVPGTDVEAPIEGDQREVTARIKEIYTASASIEFDELEILTGDEARQAAIDAGDIEPGEDVPNDVWLRDDSDATERLTVDPAAVVWVYDCTGGCERVQVDLDEFLRNEIEPYGGDGAVWEITITGETISSLLEVYLP
jgi:hypothetical protein